MTLPSRTITRLFRPSCKLLSRTRFLSSQRTPGSRAERILSRLPPSLQKYTTRLRDAPVSHVVAFLMLHEITAIVPLFGLVGLFHYTDYVPIGYMMENYDGYVREGVGRFERYFERKGWFGFGADEREMSSAGAAELEHQDGDSVMRKWESGDSKYKIVVEVALAYAVTKVLLPVRILASAWATPWFAMMPGRLRRLITIMRR